MTVKEELANLGEWLTDHGFELDAESGWWMRDASCVVAHWNRVYLIDVIVYRFPTAAANRARKGRPTWVVQMSGGTPFDTMTTVILQSISVSVTA
jgi:hypothetical protein